MQGTQRDFHPLKQTIALIGMMGAGKSSIGAALANKMDVPFYDCDAELVRRSGTDIPDLFAQEGEAGFRKMERKVLNNLLSEPPHVLATGGGTFLDPDNRALLKARARTVWLDPDIETLWQRLRPRLATRPLLQTQDPRATLDSLFAARRPIYAEAATRIDCEQCLPRSLNGVVCAIIDALQLEISDP